MKLKSNQNHEIRLFIMASYDIDTFRRFVFESTFLKRSFQLQYLFTPINSYEIAITNPTRHRHKVCLNLFNNHGEKFKSIQTELSPLGVGIVKLPRFGSNFLISIRSNLPMARPLIFKSSNETGFK